MKTPLPFIIIGKHSYETPEQAAARQLGYILEFSTGKKFVNRLKDGVRLLHDIETSGEEPWREVEGRTVYERGDYLYVKDYEPFGVFLGRYIEGSFPGNNLIPLEKTFLLDLLEVCRKMVAAWEDPELDVYGCWKAAAEAVGIEYKKEDGEKFDYFCYTIECYIRRIEALLSKGYTEFYVAFE